MLTPKEKDILRRHTFLGFELLRRQRNISLFSAHFALQHHERYDGNGYPRQLAGGEIHEYSRIVAITDVFDALTSARYHRKQYSPHEAAEYLSAAGGILFDYELIINYFSRISPFIRSPQRAY